jgi:hypothetical protein
MFEPEKTRSELADWTASLEPRRFDAEHAQSLLGTITAIHQLTGAALALLAKRVEETNAWRTEGDQSAAHWLARQTGTSVGEARANLDLVDRLDELPETAEAFRAGRLSREQARHVAAGASADPRAEAHLLETANRESLRELANEARRAVATDDAAEREARIHRNRRLRSWVDVDGTFRMDLRTTAVAGSQLLQALAPFQQVAFDAARNEGRSEPLAAYAADALVALATAAPTRSGTRVRSQRAKIIINVDAAALRRGRVTSGERCELAGVGPISVDAARRYLPDAALAVVISEGVDIRNVTHLGRKPTAQQRTALEYLGVGCAVVGCDNTDFVDVDHVLEWARTHHTTLDELDVLCTLHHRRKTRDGHRMEPGRGRRRMLPPDHPALREDDAPTLAATS